MQMIIVGLLFKSVAMTIVGFIFMCMTPLLLKRYRAKWLYYGWLLILIGFIVPLTLSTTTKVIHIVGEVGMTTQKQIPIQSTKETLVSISVDAISMLSIWQTAMILWILGIFVFWVYHLVKHYRFIRFVKKWSEAVEDSSAISLLEKLKSEMGVAVKIKIRECDFIYSPMVVGLISRSILLPTNEYNETELKAILKHELVHVKRKDIWYKVFIMIVCGIHWFNPLLYLFARELDNLCERSCDDEVVKNSDIRFRKTYSETILYAAKIQRRESVFSTNFVGSTQNIKTRILSIMDKSKKKPGIVVIALLLFLTTCGFMVSSAFAVSSKPVNYLGETFMKESISKGISTGDFSTDHLIIYPEVTDMQPVSVESDKNEKLSSDILPIGTVAHEARYRYPIEIIHRNRGSKYTTYLFIEYDYELFEAIEFEELNTLIASYLSTAEKMFKFISYEDFNADHLANRMQEFERYIDEQNVDSRVDFTVRYNGMRTNSHFFAQEE